QVLTGAPQWRPDARRSQGTEALMLPRKSWLPLAGLALQLPLASTPAASKCCPRPANKTARRTATTLRSGSPADCRAEAQSLSESIKSSVAIAAGPGLFEP